MTYFLFETRKKVGLDAVLAKIKPQSVYGREQQKNLDPLNRQALEEEFVQLKQVIEAVGSMKASRLTELRTRFSQLPSLEEGLALMQAGATLHDIALFNVRKFTVLAIAIRGLIESAGLFSPGAREPLMFPGPLEEKLKALDGKYSFSIRDFATEELLNDQKRTRSLKAELKKVREHAVQGVKEMLPPDLQEAWHQEGITVNKQDTELLEQLRGLEGFKQEGETFTRVNFKREPIEDEKRLLDEIARQEELELKKEQKARSILSQFITPYIEMYRAASRCLGWMDWAIAKAAFALEEGGAVPEVSDRAEIRIRKGVDPVLKEELAAQGRDFYPLDISLEAGVTVITGANMGGKTVALRTVGLLTAMAQHGIPVPAASMSFYPVEYLFMSGGDDLLSGLSSFGTEVEMFKSLLQEQEKVGLCLVDEPARGTNPEEGAALVAALADHFSKGPSLVTLTTHYNRVAMLPGIRHWQVRGLKDVDRLQSVADISTCFDFTIEPVEGTGVGVPQNALKVAWLLGLPPKIIAAAKEYLAEAGKGGDEHE